MSTGSEAVEGSAGRLAATEAVVTRVRTALEASRSYVFGRGIAPQPSLEAGLQRDGGTRRWARVRTRRRCWGLSAVVRRTR